MSECTGPPPLAVPVTTIEAEAGAIIDELVLTVSTELCPVESEDGENVAVTPEDAVAVRLTCELVVPVAATLISAVTD